MDVLSGGESDAGDTLRRQNNNNNSISSKLASTEEERAGSLEPRQRAADLSYFVAKELLMTERTYKRDLELITVWWSREVSTLAARGAECAPPLARACLALEPLALAAGKLLARLERALAPAHTNEIEEPEYKKIAELLYDYLSSTYDVFEEYTENAGGVVGLVENVRRCNAAARTACAAFEGQAPLPLSCLLLRPLHRRLHYHTLAQALCGSCESCESCQLCELSRRGADRARRQLRHVENHAALCQLQRDLIGYDKLLVPDREFIRMGCVYKHSTRGLQQRMLFLFNDILVLSSRAGSQFRVVGVLPLHTLRAASSDLPHSYTLHCDDVHYVISTSNEREYTGWMDALHEAIAAAQNSTADIDTTLTPTTNDNNAETSVTGSSCGGALTQVCWHRVTSLSRDELHSALQSQLSGYLLRKFKKSVGWQKLWVVAAGGALLFYKAARDPAPLAALPLLGYSVSAATASDGVDKEFVFKLQYKNHVYFFRADGPYTYSRWVEVLKSPGVYREQSDHNNK